MNLKQEAAKKAVTLIKNGVAIGLGAGSTMAFMVNCLSETKPDIQLYSSSADTKYLLQQQGFEVNDIAAASSLDMYFDGCDQFDKHLNALKSGGGIHTMEKLLASMAKEFVLVGDKQKYSEQLTTAFPLVIEVLPQAVSFILAKLPFLFSNAKAEVRTNKTTNDVIITENNNLLIDVWFVELPELSTINPLLKSITGVVETSLFYNLASKAIVAGNEGVKVMEKSF